MPPFVRAVALFVASAAAATAAPQERIDIAIAKGTAALKSRFKDGAGPIAANAGGHGIGPAALAGIALLESNVPAADPAVKAIAASVREQSYRESQTYQISLCLLFLDRLEDPADVPLIQMLGVRLLVGQTSRGGWTYGCVPTPIPAGDEQRLRTGLKSAELIAGKDGAPPKLHPMAQEYLTALVNARGPAKVEGGDNSNTQFGVLATWVSRKHGVPVEGALDLIERRFLGTQAPDGSWTYALDTVGVAGSPQMTCAGLLGLATAIGRREEKRAKADAPKGEPPAKSNDPFFNPPPRPEGKGPVGPKRPPDARDQAAGRGFGFLGAALRAGGPGLQNLYLLWSLERVGVLYGMDRIGGVDWYAGGSDYLCGVQAPDGTWAGEYGADVDTSFAVLFLCKANLARDLSRRVRGDAGGSELRAGAATVVEVAPMAKGAVAQGNPLPQPVAAPLPPGAAGKVATDLIGANGPGLVKALAAARDAKGGDYTIGIAAAVHRLDGDAKKAAREALAERLARMSATTLRALMTSTDPEVRRGAVVAAAMRDDKDHIPDLIGRVNDEDDRVVRAARAGLRSLTGVDHGPATDAGPGARSQAQAAWRTWWASQKR